jgi:hypothetical protein
MGLAQETFRALGRSQEELAIPAREPVPDRIMYVTPAALAGGRGSELRRLAVHQDGAARRASLRESLELLERGASGMEDAHTRTRSRYLANAVDAYQLVGEYEAASTAAERLAESIAPVSSVRTRAEICLIRERLDDEPKDPAVRALVEQLDRAVRPPTRA